MPTLAEIQGWMNRGVAAQRAGRGSHDYNLDTLVELRDRPADEAKWIIAAWWHGWHTAELLEGSTHA